MIKIKLVSNNQDLVKPTPAIMETLKHIAAEGVIYGDYGVKFVVSNAFLTIMEAWDEEHGTHQQGVFISDLPNRELDYLVHPSLTQDAPYAWKTDKTPLSFLMGGLVIATARITPMKIKMDELLDDNVVFVKVQASKENTLEVINNITTISNCSFDEITDLLDFIDGNNIVPKEEFYFHDPVSKKIIVSVSKYEELTARLKKSIDDIVSNVYSKRV